ncbi:MAG: hypothetical protein KJ069_15050 [Anaerolineae bacterium]|nr:hypothetical protein [Anaerolineae bacterium]
MLNGKRLIGMVLLVSFLFAGLVLSASPAAAATEWRSTWVVDVDFVGNTPNALLTVTVERDTGGGWVLFAEEARQLTCVRDGGVLLVNDTAVFDGTGNIRCDMPSVRGIVRQMTDGRHTPTPNCDCKGNPIMTADVSLNPNITGSDRQNPLASRVTPLGAMDMALAAPVPAFSTTPLSSLLFTVGKETAQSNPFIASALPNVLQATYFAVGDWHQADFMANGVNPGTGAGPVADLAVSNDATILYIGYSPLTGESLHGTLEDLSLDPGCYGTG